MNRNHFATRRGILILLVCFMSCSVIAQKVNLDTLTMDQLNLYKNKAATMRNAGIIVTLGGIGVSVAGMIIGERIAEDRTLAITASSLTFGIATTAVGVPLWAIGGTRLAKAEYYADPHLYEAATMRNTGIIVTVVGAGASVTGSIIGLYAVRNDDPGAASVALIYGAVGVLCLAVGIPLWVERAKRKTEAEFTLQRINIAPQGSMALGLGMTIRF